MACKNNIILTSTCIISSVTCVVLTFWGQIKNNGTISHSQMEKMVEKVYATFNKKRKEQEAIEADFQDLEELKQIEDRLKVR